MCSQVISRLIYIVFRARVQTRATTIEVRHFFLILPLDFGAYDLSPRPDLEKNQNCYAPDEKSHGLGTQGESCNFVFGYFRRFWVKEPRDSETNLSHEKCHLYRVARVGIVDPSGCANERLRNRFSGEMLS